MKVVLSFVALFLSVLSKKTPLINDKVASTLQCASCRESLSWAFDKVKDARQSAPYGKLDELSVEEVIDEICVPNSKPGEWMRRQHIVIDESSKEAKGQALSLEQPGGIAKCEADCKTLAKSCEKLQEDLDRDRLSGLLFSKSTEKTKFLSSMCKPYCKKPAVLPKGLNWEPTEFRPMTDKELQIEELMASMNKAGLGGAMKMYSREDMADLAGGEGMDEDDYADDYGDQRNEAAANEEF